MKYKMFWAVAWGDRIGLMDGGDGQLAERSDVLELYWIECNERPTLKIEVYNACDCIMLVDQADVPYPVYGIAFPQGEDETIDEDDANEMVSQYMGT